MYARIAFFRDVAGWYEDKFPVQLGGEGKWLKVTGCSLLGSPSVG